MSEGPSLESSQPAFNSFVNDYAKYLAYPQLTTDKVNIFLLFLMI